MMNIRAVFVLILFLLMAACAASPPEAAQPTPSVSPAVTAAPAVPTPTLTPEPTAAPTLTAVELRDLRATAVLTTLPGYDPTHHEALLPLARALWGESDLADPAMVTIVAGETAVQVNADASGSYLPGTLFLWRGAELLLLLPAAPDQTIEPGQVTLPGETVQTWVAYDGAGAMARFLHPAAAQWITPLDLSETGGFNLFLAQDIFPDGQAGAVTVWWANGGTPVELTTSPNSSQSLAEFLGDGSRYRLTETTVDNQNRAALADADGTVRFTYDAETREWQEAISPTEAFYAQAQELYGEPYGITLDSNVEVRPDGNMAIYATVNGQRVEVVSTARNLDSNPVFNEAGQYTAVFRTENWAMANSIPLAGGDLGTIKYVYDQRLTPQLGEATLSVVSGRESQVQAWKDRILEIPERAAVINPLAPEVLGGPYNQPMNHLLTKEQADQITNIVFYIGINTHEIPGFRPIYRIVTPKLGSSWVEEITTLWNPEQPNTIIIVSRSELSRIFDDLSTDSWTFFVTIMGHISNLHVNSGRRPTFGYNDLQMGDINQGTLDLLNQAYDSDNSAFKINGLKK